jgi:hypothetical protein
MMLQNRMPLRPGLLWLTLNLALIIQCLSRNNIYFLADLRTPQDVFAYPLRCFRVPLKMFSGARGLRIPQFEDHCSRQVSRIAVRFSALRAGRALTSRILVLISVRGW